MDILASHRWGLIEQLEAEADGLAGRGGDTRQRAMVWFHLSDILGHGHDFALLRAGSSLAIERRLAALRRAVWRSRWRWWSPTNPAARAALLERVDAFGSALREADRATLRAALLAYRLVATPGVADEGRARLDPALVAALDAGCTARREGVGVAAHARRALFAAHLDLAQRECGSALDAAVGALDWPLGRRVVAAAVATVRLTPASLERQMRRGPAAAIRRVTGSKSQPPAFAANPSQAFFALQRQLAERRRRQRAEGGDDDSVRIAA